MKKAVVVLALLVGACASPINHKPEPEKWVPSDTVFRQGEDIIILRQLGVRAHICKNDGSTWIINRLARMAKKHPMPCPPDALKALRTKKPSIVLKNGKNV